MFADGCNQWFQLGSNIFQTFLAGPLAFKVLPRPQFSTLQQAIFPPYFSFQTILPLVLALTWPGEKLASAGDAIVRQHAGPRGIAEGDNVWLALTPIAIMFGTSLLNLVILGPATTKVMKERKHQGMEKHSVSDPRKLTCWQKHEMESDIMIQDQNRSRCND